MELLQSFYVAFIQLLCSFYVPLQFVESKRSFYKADPLYEEFLYVAVRQYLLNFEATINLLRSCSIADAGSLSYFLCRAQSQNEILDEFQNHRAYYSSALKFFSFLTFPPLKLVQLVCWSNHVLSTLFSRFLLLGSKTRSLELVSMNWRHSVVSKAMS